MKPIVIYVPSEEYDMILRASKKRGLSISQYVWSLVHREMTRKKSEKEKGGILWT